MRIATDIAGLDRNAPAGIRIQVIPGRILALIREARQSQMLIVHFSLMRVILLAVGLSGSRCKLVTLDFFTASTRWWLRSIASWALRRVHLMLVYFRDTSRFEKVYRLRKEQFRYIPFKVNSWELVQSTQPVEGDFIFVGGRSRRDFRTLFEAARGLPYPIKILTAHEADLAPHGSSLAGLSVPENVEILYNDSDSRYFVDLLSRCKMAVLPILPGLAVQAGIGVYILAMALRKCVVISEGLGVSDVLLERQALIVPPGDASKLRDAIVTLWNDDDARRAYADRAWSYATALGGEDALRESILRAVLERSIV